jgi:hypothetical protein
MKLKQTKEYAVVEHALQRPVHGCHPLQLCGDFVGSVFVLHLVALSPLAPSSTKRGRADEYSTSAIAPVPGSCLTAAESRDKKP